LEVNAIVEEIPEKGKEMSPIKAHCQLGHLSIQATKDAAACLGWHLKGNFERCEDCAIGKGCQKNVNKKTDHKVADNVGEQILFDVVSVQEQQESEVNNNSAQKQYWRIMVDEKSQFKISDFFISKKAMIEHTCEKLLKLRSDGKLVKFICCDDGGENRVLMNGLQGSDWKIPVQFEFTGRDTPQQNH
jgi:hypothetical protein